MTARQTALLAACMGFCAMRQLQLASQPPSFHTVALEERMLANVASYLARRDILDLQRGAFVRLALGRFSHSLSVLKGLTPGLHSSKTSPKQLSHPSASQTPLQHHQDLQRSSRRQLCSLHRCVLDLGSIIRCESTSVPCRWGSGKRGACNASQ